MIVTHGPEALRRRCFLPLFAVFTAIVVWLFCSPTIKEYADYTPILCDRLPSKVPCTRSSQPYIPTVSDQEILGLPPNARAEAVKEAFEFAFQSYWKHCQGHDELAPVSTRCKDPFNHWGASAVDALSTAVIMRLDSTVKDILDFIPAINFTQTRGGKVSLFENTIRYLGGMVSGYDLLKDPLLASVYSESAGLDSLLNQSRALADAMKFGFDSPTGIPHNDLFINQTWADIRTNGLATAGSLILEWQRLSDLTGDPTYGELAAKGESYLLDPQPAYNVPFPGLPGTRINIKDGLFIDANGGWNGGDDSYYEYLIKMYVYDSDRFSNYKDAWIEAADSTIKHLASHPSSRPDLTFLAAFQNHTIIARGTHLGCFAGGNFLLGGHVLHRQDYIDFGLRLVHGCHETYAATATGIGPEDFSWNNTDVPRGQKAFYRKHGFWIANPAYVLRPEVIESYYYAYRITGERKYQDWAWDAFVAINRTCRVQHRSRGFTSVDDVNKPHGGGAKDKQESFLFAEVMKYSYMIQSEEDGPWQVNYRGGNEFVFNTEAHPLRVAGPSRVGE